MINYFRILGVKASANEDEIKKAYKRLSNKYHPDKLLALSDDEKEQGCCHVHDAEFFMIDSKYPLAPALCGNRALKCTHGRCRRGKAFNIGHEILRLLQREQVGNEFFDIRFAQTEVWHSAIFATSLGKQCWIGVHRLHFRGVSQPASQIRLVQTILGNSCKIFRAE